MIQAGSLIGFAATFLVASWVTSAAVGALVLSYRQRLRAAGPRAERRAAAFGLLLPPLVSGLVVSILAGASLAGGPADHCPLHLHHLHLCLFHGGSWADQAWAVATVALMGTLAVTRGVRHVTHLASARSALRRVESVSTRLASSAGEVWLAPASKAFCFVAGLVRPRIFVSTAAWSRLAEDERAAMLAHESAHAEQGDVWKRSTLSVVSWFAAPLVGSALLGRWSSATERLCDQRAALALGEPESVARALMNVARSDVGREPVSSACFMPAGSDVVERVEAVLASGGDGRALARSFGRAATLFVIAVAVGSIALADPIHHALETLIGAH